MIIIIEGPDGSGKTTLAEQLSKQTGYKIVHRDKPKTEEEKAKMFAEYAQAIKGKENFIFDRSWYSEMVYGNVMRDASVITYPHMYNLERALARHGAILIYCSDKENRLWDRCQKRGEEYITDRHTFHQICCGYEELMSCPHLIPVVRYGFED